jgi:hypothetical protein
MCSFFSRFLVMILTDLSERVKRVENMRNLPKVLSGKH